MSYLVPKDIPNCCADCPAEIYERDENDLLCAICQQTGKEIDGIDTTKKRADFCTLIEIKTPHGNLIDKDKLTEEFMDSDLDHLQRDDWKEVIQIVADAPTVIEAED